MPMTDDEKKGIYDEMDRRMDGKFTAFKNDMGTMIKDAVVLAMKPADKPADKPVDPPKNDALTPQQLHQLASERADLLALAKTHGVEVKPEHDNAAIRKAVVLKAKTDARTDADDAYYKAALDFLPKTDSAGQQPAEPNPYAQMSTLIPRTDAAKTGQPAATVAPHAMGMASLMSMNKPKS